VNIAAAVFDQRIKLIFIHRRFDRERPADIHTKKQTLIRATCSRMSRAVSGGSSSF
jgi:hypothetical protein